MKNLIWLISLLLCLGAFYSCEDEDPVINENTTENENPGENENETPDPVEVVPATPEERQKLLSGVNDFTFEIFKRTCANADAGENVFISPFSVSMALSMLNNGAAGSTREAISSTLGFSDLEIDQINSAYRDVYQNLETLDPAVQLDVANSIWWDALGISPYDQFLDTNQLYYEAECSEEDFRNPATVDVINSWVSDNTDGKIEEILEEITPEEVMFLINAIYFKGLWKTPFDPDDTWESGFQTSDGEWLSVPMMSESGTSRAMYAGENYDAIELAYGDSLFTMTLLRPSDDISAEELAQGFSRTEWENLSQGLGSPFVAELSLPKLELDFEISYGEILSNMGMAEAFQSGANLTAIGTDCGPLKISKVLHKTYLKLDEEGTTAAAVTSVGVAVTSLPPSLRFNKPFLMVLSEKESGAILFIGKVENPSAE